MRSKSMIIVWYAVVTASCFVACMLDCLLGRVLPLNPAVCMLAVSFTFALYKPTLKNCFAVLTILGVCSLVVSVILPSGFTPYFLNPLVTVIPRSIVGIVLFLVYKALSKANQIVAIAVSSVVAVAVNTITVMTMIFAFSPLYGDAMTFEYVLSLVLTTNSLLEVIITPVLTVPIVLALRRSRADKEI